MTDAVKVHECISVGETVAKHCRCRHRVPYAYAETLVSTGAAAWYVPKVGGRYRSSVVLCARVHTLPQIPGRVSEETNATGKGSVRNVYGLDPMSRGSGLQGYGKFITGGNVAEKNADACSRFPKSAKKSDLSEVEGKETGVRVDATIPWDDLRPPLPTKQCEVTLVCTCCNKSVDANLNVYDDADTPAQYFGRYTCADCLPHGVTGERWHENRRRGAMSDDVRKWYDSHNYAFGKSGSRKLAGMTGKVGDAVEYSDTTDLEREQDGAWLAAERGKYRWDLYAKIH